MIPETVDQTQRFYDALASDYDLIFADWQASVRRQAEILDRIIREHHLTTWRLSVLDCTCGIGTQAIGLARRGYRVHATDLSTAAVGRAEREAALAGARSRSGSRMFGRSPSRLPRTSTWCSRVTTPYRIC